MGLHELGTHQAAYNRKSSVIYGFLLNRACSVIIDGSEDVGRSYGLLKIISILCIE